MNLQDKRALVTGGTDGIGAELARRLRDEGCSIVVVGRSEVRLERARALGYETIRADLSGPEGCDAVIGAADGAGIDILINNAGVDPAYVVGQPVDMDAVERAIYLNLNAPIRLITGLIDGLAARPQACIVNVTSGLAIAPSADTPVYCASKAGLRAFTLSLRAQLSNTSVRVIEALPPMVDTRMTQAIEKKGKMRPSDCAEEIVSAIVRDRTEANIGEVKLLRMIYSLSPRLARRLMIAS